MFLYALLSALNDIISRSQKGEGLTRRDLAVLRLFDGLSGTAFAGLAGLYLQYAPHNPLLDLLAGSLGTGLAGAFLRWRNSPDGQLVLDDGTSTGNPASSPAENTAAPAAPPDPNATQVGLPVPPRMVPVTNATLQTTPPVTMTTSAAAPPAAPPPDAFLL